ncbi:transposase [Streptomyces sp. NRRL F-2664]|uniref:transposase n=1 Tax=Streptomyces sp. NRRL F-2664 TaxID=1463842 RepID=UPI001F255591|nr:transposase [Streptomyces sp. NRRL F-2664]
MLDELASNGLRPAVLVADTGYGANADFRRGLEDRGRATSAGQSRNDRLQTDSGGQDPAYPADRAVARGRGRTGEVLDLEPAADIPATDLVRLAKARWRIEHRELKTARSFTGWHRHVTLVTAAHPLLTEQRRTPRAPARA